jgi:hypothetical protein
MLVYKQGSRPVPEKPTQITVLVPLPTFYNPDSAGVRELIEEDKFLTTAAEISERFGGGMLHRFTTQPPAGFWWSRGILSQDEMSVFEVDMLDTEENRRWIRAYAKDVLLKRFRQDAIYLKFIGPVESLEVTEETVLE